MLKSPHISSLEGAGVRAHEEEASKESYQDLADLRSFVNSLFFFLQSHTQYSLSALTSSKFNHFELKSYSIAHTLSSRHFKPKKSRVVQLQYDLYSSKYGNTKTSNSNLSANKALKGNAIYPEHMVHQITAKEKFETIFLVEIMGLPSSIYTH